MLLASDAMEAWLRNLNDLWERVQLGKRVGVSGFCEVHGPIPGQVILATCPLTNSRIVDDAIEVFICDLPLAPQPKP